MPERIQLRRTKGWRLPENTIVVSRPSKWGNPFVVGEDVPPEARRFLVDPTDPHRDGLLRALASLSRVKITQQQAVDAHAWWILEQPHLMLSLGELRGHDLACWCKPGPCHADTLIELSN